MKPVHHEADLGLYITNIMTRSERSITSYDLCLTRTSQDMSS